MNEKKNDIRGKKKSVKEVLTLLFLCFFPLLLVTGCGIGNCIQCSNCGDDNTRVLVYAKGADNNGVEYTSCVGPAGILGCGLNSKFWPTECVSAKSSKEGTTLSGCITYYNAFGCIDKSEVKSVGRYSGTSCLCVKCISNDEYVETVAETTKATEQTKCLGFGCGGKEFVTPYNYNSTMPRLFPKGCWSSEE